ncbi:hypothetical protein CMT41_16785 [Colwellia sp. MT41]|uniref:RHS repeat-associated core domain-containing protein n=1 Tax=Colwellia sp. MT41 TaxID=58049 RepID=UPI00071796FA|nr:RHS repeat-associated core domain-containing protein [Colwellia sp. MT41]ALO36201.1 hypothetical protein CMT41_16785 [Colwellia sp. MT41]
MKINLISITFLSIMSLLTTFSHTVNAGAPGVECARVRTSSGGGWVSQQVCWINGGGGGGGGGGSYTPPPSGGGGSYTPPTTPPVENSCAGNPVLIASGKKYQHSVDHTSSNGWLNIERFYSQTQNRTGMLGSKWQTNHDLSISIQKNSLGEAAYATLYRANGSSINLFYSTTTTNWHYLDGRVALFNFVNDAQLWIFQSDKGITENYTLEGKISSQFNVQRQGIFYRYQDNKLVQINSTGGKSLNITYNEQELVAAISVEGVEYQYTYSNNLLSSVTQADGTRYQYYYEDERYNGALTRIDINNINYARWQYDDQARAMFSEHAGGAERTEFTYHDNESTTVKNSLGKETTYHFTTINGKKLPTFIEGHESGACYAANKAYSYDIFGNQDKITDWQGNITDFDFNSRGLLEQKTVAFGTANAQTTHYQWHNQYPLPLSKTTDHTTTYYQYDENFRLIEKSTTANNTGEVRSWAYSYILHDNGNIKQSTSNGPKSGDQDVVIRLYNEQGYLLKVSNALGHHQKYGNYNALGKAGYKISINGVKTTFKYDNKGRLIESKVKDKNKGNQKTKFSYNSLNQLIETTAANGAKTYYHYNDAYQNTGHTNALGDEIRFTLDAAGNVVEKTDIKDEQAWTFSEGCSADNDDDYNQDNENELACSASEKLVQETLFDTNINKSYDALSRITQVNRGGDIVGSFSYDANNNLVSAIDGEGKVTRYEYDSLNRKIAETGADNQTTYFQYNQQNLITRITDARGNSTTYNYNDFAELIELNSPDSGISTFSYNEAGNKLSHTRADGTTLTFSYDILGRITQTNHNENTLYKYSYDQCKNGTGKLCQLNDLSGKTSYRYHKTGALKSKEITLANSQYKLSYKYNTQGLVRQISYPSGLKINYRYNELGEVIKVKANDETLVSNIAYKSFGAIKFWTFGNGQQRAIQYTNKQRISRILATNVQDLRYQYDRANNIISLENLRYDRINNFAYDVLNRLTVIAGNEFASYQYDSLGNRLTEERFANSDQYLLAADSNRLLSVSNTNGERVFSYDVNGNIVTDNTTNINKANVNKNSVNKAFIYNAENRMVKSTVNGKSTYYQYNAHGKRVSKTLDDGTVIHYIYGIAGQLLAESNNGNISKEYIYLNDQLVALYNNKGNNRKGKSKKNSSKHQYKHKKSHKEMLYVHTDHLGRPEIVTDKHQNTVWQANNKAFDREVIRDDIGNLNIGFPGQYWDEEKQSWYNGFRDYDATIGRYLQSDPIGVNGGINTYNYVLSNPLTFVDILGLGPKGGFPDDGPRDSGGSNSPCSYNLNSEQVNTLTLIAQLLEAYKTQTSVLIAVQNGYNLGSISAGILKNTLLLGLRDIEYFQQVNMHIVSAQGSVIAWQNLRIDWNQYGARNSTPEQVLQNFINGVNKP